MKNTGIIVLTLFFTISTISAENKAQKQKLHWDKIEKYALLDRPESILKELDIIIANAQKMDNFDQLIKALIYKVRFETAQNPTKIGSFINDLETLNKKDLSFEKNALIHSMLAELYTGIYLSDQWKFDQRAFSERKNPEDINEWRRNNFVEKISAHINYSTNDGKKLEKSTTNQYPSIIERKNDDNIPQSSLFDLLVNRGIKILNRIENQNFEHIFHNSNFFSAKDKFIKLQLDSNYHNSTENQILQLYQQLIEYFSKTKNETALISCDLERIRYVYNHSNRLKTDSIYLQSLKNIRDEFPGNARIVEVMVEEAQYYWEKYNEIPVEKDQQQSNNMYLKTKALEICAEGINRFPSYKRIGLLKNLQNQITKKQIDFTYNNTVRAGKDINVEINSSNIKELILKVYQVYCSGIEYKTYQNNNPLKKLFPTSKLIEVIKIPVDTSLNRNVNTTQIIIPKKNFGIYEFTVEDANWKKLGNNTIGSFTVTNMAFISRSIEQKVEKVYVLDRQSGIPQSGVTVKVYNMKWDYPKFTTEPNSKLQTDENGYCQYQFQANYDNQLLCFEKGADKYYAESNQSNFFHPNEWQNPNIQSELLIDRAIYRPGQKVYVKGILYVSNKNLQRTANNIECQIELYDANNQKIDEKRGKSNDFGSFVCEFILPSKSINGNYRIKLNNCSKSILVEEYKRPSFEITISEPTTEMHFGEKIKLNGFVKSFGGYPLNNATVKYTITRLHNSRFRRIKNMEMTIENQSIKNNPDGSFSIDFYPQKENSDDKNEQVYAYTVSIDVTNENGETQTVERNLYIGDKTLVINAKIPEKINKVLPNKIQVYAETLNGYRKKTTIKYTLTSLQNSELYLEQLTENSKFNDEKIELSGNVEASNETLSLDLSKLKSGYYKLSLSTIDTLGNEIKLEKQFILYSDQENKPAIKTYCWLETPVNECKVGDSAIIRFGTSTTSSLVLFEIMKGNKVFSSKWIPFNDEIKTLNIPFEEKYGSGITVLFSFFKDDQFFSKTILLRRALEIKKLSPKLIGFKNKLSPGEAVECTVKIPLTENSQNKTEILVEMYDASLDKIQPHNWTFNPTYKENILMSPAWQSPNFNKISQWVDFPIKYFSIEELRNKKINWFGFEATSSVIGNENHLYGMTTGEIRLKSNSKSMTIDDEAVKSVNTSASILIEKNNLDSDEKGNESKNIQVRKNFNETAFFYPQLQTDTDGNAKFLINTPGSITRWKIKLLAHNQDLYIAQIDTTLITQKDLIVEMNLPRFARQTDQLTLSASVKNLSGKDIDAKLKLQILDAQTNKLIFSKEKNVKQLANNENKAVSWNVNEFANSSLIICKVQASSGTLSDAEEKYLQILPKKITVQQSIPISLKANEALKLNLDSILNKNNSNKSGRLFLEFVSNPVWYAIQALPYISNSITNNAIDLFSGYYANTFASGLIQSDSSIFAMLERWKREENTEILHSNLTKNTDLKLLELSETPWINDAKNETEQKQQLIELLDSGNLSYKTMLFLDKLFELQLPSGGFSWMTGMPENKYITIEILLNLAKIRKFSHLLPAQNLKIEKAIAYLDKDITLKYNTIKQAQPNDEKTELIEPTLLLYLRMRSEYGKPQTDTKTNEAIKYFSEKIQNNWQSQSLFNKALIAIIAWRSRNLDLAKNIVISLNETAIKSTKMGMYWAKNTGGNCWNERPIIVHSAIMEAFSEISNTTKEIDEMKIWLLKQKQTQHWDSPISTVNAINSLMQCGNNNLSNSGGIEIEVNHETLKIQKNESGTGYFKQEITGINQNKSMGEMSISKTNGGISWGALYYLDKQEISKISAQSESLKIKKTLLVERKSNKEIVLVPIENTKLYKGDKVITRLVISTNRDFEYVVIKDLRPACLEPIEQRSTNHWKENLIYFQSTKDASTQFFFDSLPKGTYVFDYECRINNSGEFNIGFSTIQCLYAPEFIANSTGGMITVH